MIAPARFSWIFLALLPWTVQAEKFNPYQVLTPISDASEAARLSGLRVALGTVLVRLTGDSRADTLAETQPILNRAPTLAQGYGFEKQNGLLMLRAVFDAAAVESAVRATGLPVWITSRPTYTLWVALDDGSRQIVSRADATRVKALLDVADRRGVGLTLPLGDETDARLLDFDTLWRGQTTSVQTAARRYGSDAALALRVARQGSGWAVRWQRVADGGIEQEWISGANSMETALAQGLNRLADDLARQFAIRSVGMARELRIAVRGINNLGDYARTLNHLKGLGALKSVFVERLETRTLWLRLQTDSEEGSVRRLLAANGPLRDIGDLEGARGYDFIP